MTWLQLRLDARPSTVEALEDVMLASGAVAVTMEDNADDPVLEPGVGETPLWQHIRVTGLYPADTDMSTVLSQFSTGQLEHCAQRIEILKHTDMRTEMLVLQQHLVPPLLYPDIIIVGHSVITDDLKTFFQQQARQMKSDKTSSASD